MYYVLHYVKERANETLKQLRLLNTAVMWNRDEKCHAENSCVLFLNKKIFRCKNISDHFSTLIKFSENYPLTFNKQP